MTGGPSRPRAAAAGGQECWPVVSCGARRGRSSSACCRCFVPVRGDRRRRGAQRSRSTCCSPARARRRVHEVGGALQAVGRAQQMQPTSPGHRPSVSRRVSGTRRARTAARRATPHAQDPTPAPSATPSPSRSTRPCSAVQRRCGRPPGPGRGALVVVVQVAQQGVHGRCPHPRARCTVSPSRTVPAR